MGSPTQRVLMIAFGALTLMVVVLVFRGLCGASGLYLWLALGLFVWAVTERRKPVAIFALVLFFAPVCMWGFLHDMLRYDPNAPNATQSANSDSRQDWLMIEAPVGAWSRPIMVPYTQRLRWASADAVSRVDVRLDQNNNRILTAEQVYDREKVRTDAIWQDAGLVEFKSREDKPVQIRYRLLPK